MCTERFGLSVNEPEKGAEGTTHPAVFTLPLSSSKANSLEEPLDFHSGLFHLTVTHTAPPPSCHIRRHPVLRMELLTASHFYQRGPLFYNQTLSSLDKIVNYFQDVCLFLLYSIYICCGTRCIKYFTWEFVPP